MTKEEILSRVDHTILAPAATWAEVRAVCDAGLRHKTASVCIPPAFVERGRAYLANTLAICTVIGFPNGYTTAKAAEAADALRLGADELDMVINLGDVKSGDFESVRKEIMEIKGLCGSRILKVIVEACLLTREEKLLICKTVTDAGADFIKTSTGFSTGGATIADVRLFREHVGASVRVKASGGIKTLEAAEEFLKAGADRLGASALAGWINEY